MPRPLAAAAILGFCAVLAVQSVFVARQHALMGDFQAFYCAGKVLAAGENPYASLPVRACERPAQPFGLHHTDPGVTEPAPYPGYAMAVFVPFAMLPYVAACVIWLALLIAAIFFSAVELARLTGRTFAGALAVLTCGFAIAVLPYGELPPIVLAALLVAMRALREGRAWLAAACLSVAALLPHVALPIWFSVFFLERRARLPLAVWGAMLIALDVAAGGPRMAAQYLLTVLPQHARSEIGYIMQYGVTWIAHAAGARDAVAILAGNASYALMLFVGIVLAARAAAYWNDRAYVLAIPIALIVFGGPFIHYTDILLAIPAGVLLWTRAPHPWKNIAAAGTLGIAFPWLWVPQGWVIAPFAIYAAAISAALFGWSPRAALRVALIPPAIAAVILTVAIALGPQISAHASNLHLDASLAQASWAAKIQSGLVSSGVVWWIAKAPTWIGLALIALTAAVRPAPHTLYAAGAAATRSLQQPAP